MIDEFIRALRDRGYVDVGVMGDESYEDGVTVVDVARWAEFGLGQPQRSWLRATVDMNRAKINDRIRKEMKAVFQGKRSMRQALDRVGLYVVGLIQQRIADGIEPANAESTVAQKGSSKPLIDTGQLRGSISSRTRVETK